ncbi:response regulator [Acidisphaera rubrifaciens]|uniref:Two component transcriptional regulator n=1 Tax=Acidisphaera rubrifaciens HS-AP3 TaxID=1231350 RepID=A0A0D6P6X6_9PROT|nr:response regulator [Acidisphaera rubrifaciens]GAN77422.1 two component transcriptional regulator [Acidisphaera rubrifaciens HS-AP3]
MTDTAQDQTQPHDGRATAAARILFVDDEEGVRLVVGDFLASIGYDVLVEADGAAALRRIESDPSITLLISDVRMAGLSGIDLARAASRLRPALRILVTSGYFLPQTVPWPFLRKPFRLGELEAAVTAALG